MIASMWFPNAADDDRWADAIVHLRRDRVMRGIVDAVGPCTLRPKRNAYLKLVQSILSQQVSVKAAAAMFVKLKSKMPAKRVTPANVVAFLSTADEESIRSCGLSRQKRAYVMDLSQRFASGEIRPARFGKMTDDEIVAELTPIKGIGRWTVEMLLIFGLNRPDVWPVDDLGIQEAVRHFWKLPERPKPKQILDFADAWRPWRSVASWYLWRGPRG
jgi:DNA-3-methyladenine glycosylase II